MSLDNEAATKEVAVGQWPETSAGEKQCSTPVTTFIQLNFFKYNGAKKPTPAASTYGDLDVAFAYFRDPQLFGLGAADPGATTAFFGNLELFGLGATGASK